MTADNTRAVYWRGRAHHLAAGGTVSLVLTLAVASLSTWPVWQSLPPGTALVRLSFTHSGVRSCRDRTSEELANLPPNMRDKKACERRRAPVRIEMDVDGRPILAVDLPPSGLAGSGPSRIYRRVQLFAGNYHVNLRMRDDPSAQSFTHEAAFDIELSVAESLAIDFDSSSGSFFLH